MFFLISEVMLDHMVLFGLNLGNRMIVFIRVYYFEFILKVGKNDKL